MVTIDFETQAIGHRPAAYPPKSVGVAVHMEKGTRPFYAAWGHPSGNNSTWEKGRAALARVWDQQLLFHNGAGFDIQVAMEEFGLPWPRRWEDTLFQLYLHAPHARTLSLKPSVERLCGVVPVERDELKAWVLANIPGAKPASWGAHIAQAPGELVGRYAAADVTQTRMLHTYLYKRISKAEMLAAYAREKALAPILHAAERRGVRCNLELLEHDALFYTEILAQVDAELRATLRADINLDSNEELADALEAAGLVTAWVATPTGKRSTAAANMEIALGATPLAQKLRYRGALATCLGTFMGPWCQWARATGRLYPTWHQVRNPAGDAGTRTGRLSCSNPNLMNVAKEFEKVVVPVGLPPLPLMRQYLLPKAGCVWARRDYNQQEMRILAHYEDGAMLQQYAANPRIDFHALAQQLILANTGRDLPRKDVKTTGFSILYGSGAAHLANKLGCTPQAAQELKYAYYSAITGIRALQKELKQRAALGQPLRTWGGRLYYCEEPTTDKNGVYHSYEYKLLNYLIQGSAADCTKQAVLNYAQARKHGEFLIQVHDEINISVPKQHLKSEMKILEDCMAAVKFDVPMLSDGSWGPNYQELEAL